MLRGSFAQVNMFHVEHKTDSRGFSIREVLLQAR